MQGITNLFTSQAITDSKKVDVLLDVKNIGLKTAELFCGILFWSELGVLTDQKIQEDFEGNVPKQRFIKRFAMKPVSVLMGAESGSYPKQGRKRKHEEGEKMYKKRMKIISNAEQRLLQALEFVLTSLEQISERNGGMNPDKTRRVVGFSIDDVNAVRCRLSKLKELKHVKSSRSQCYRELIDGDLPYHGTKSLFVRALQSHQSLKTVKFLRDGFGAHPVGYREVYIDVMNQTHVAPHSDPDAKCLDDRMRKSMKYSLEQLQRGSRESNIEIVCFLQDVPSVVVLPKKGELNRRSNTVTSGMDPELDGNDRVFLDLQSDQTVPCDHVMKDVNEKDFVATSYLWYGSVCSHLLREERSKRLEAVMVGGSLEIANWAFTAASRFQGANGKAEFCNGPWS